MLLHLVVLKERFYLCDYWISRILRAFLIVKNCKKRTLTCILILYVCLHISVGPNRRYIDENFSHFPPFFQFGSLSIFFYYFLKTLASDLTDARLMWIFSIFHLFSSLPPYLFICYFLKNLASVVADAILVRFFSLPTFF